MDILGSLNSVGISVVAFVGVFSVLVFFHEYGHFWVARRFGVRVDTFSIGFGPTLKRWYDRNGIEWRIALLPLGGYVKFWGDANGASTPSDDVAAMSEADRKDCFHFKPLYQRALIVAAGPAANFLLAIVLYAGIFMTAGQSYTPPVVDEVVPGTAAESAGLQSGDRIVEIDGVGIETFEELADLIAFNPGKPMEFHFIRDGQDRRIVAAPSRIVRETLVGDREIGQMGIRPAQRESIHRGPVEAFWYAGLETRDKVVLVLRTVWELATLSRSVDELSGPLGIGHISGQIAQVSFVMLVMFAAMLSINLGLINLFPIPMLDGGHLLYYACEAVRGRPLGERVQEYGFRVGLALVLLLMVVVTFNDIRNFVS